MECLEQIWINIPPQKIADPLTKTWSYGLSRSQKVDCGKCAYCLTNKRNAWTFRIYQEMKSQPHRGWFLTLTYNDKFVPRKEEGLSLRFRDVQKFLKRLRKKHYLKYVCVGEYGTKTKRPHYHIILWTNASVKEIEKQWFYGNIHFGTLTPASASYAMKYIIQPKKDYGKLEKPRAQFSKGLGLSFLSERMYDYLTQDYEDPILFIYVDGTKVSIPKYYKDKIFTKYQKKTAGHRFAEQRDRQKTAQIMGLREQGISNPDAYLYQLRKTKNDMIFEKQKVNQKL